MTTIQGKTKSKVEFRLNQNDLSPVDRILPSMNWSLSFQLAFLLVRKHWHLGDNDLVQRAVMDDFRCYNEQHFSSALLEKNMRDRMCIAIDAMSEGNNNVGNTVLNGEIVLSLTVHV